MVDGATTGSPTPLGGPAVVCLVAMDISGLPLLFWIARDPSPWVGAIFWSVLVGQLCVIALVAGLTHRSWLWGYGRGLGVISIGIGAVFLGLAAIEVFEMDMLTYVCFVPAILLAVSLPSILWRWLLGWRLQVAPRATECVSRLRLEDLFLVMAIAAAALMLLRVPQVHWEIDQRDFLGHVAKAGAFLVGVGAFVLPTGAWFGLGGQAGHVRLGGLLCSFALAAGVIWWVFPASAITLVDARSAPLAGFVIIAFGEFYGALFLMRGLGTRLLTGKHDLTASSPQTAAALRGRIWTRCLVAFIVVATGITSHWLARIQAIRVLQDQMIERLEPVAKKTGGWLHSHKHQIKSVRLGDLATDADVAKFAECSDLNYADFSCAKLSDDGLKRLEKLSQMESLFLNGSAISDGGMAALKGLTQLKVLALQDTSITGRGLEQLRFSQLTQLRLENSQFDDRGCSMLPRFRELRYLYLDGTQLTDQGLVSIGKLAQLKTLELANTRITDAGLANLATLTSLESLDVSGTDIRGDGLRACWKLPKLTALRLDRTQLDQRTTAAIAGCRQLSELQVRYTAINDAALLKLKDLPILLFDIVGTSVTVGGLVAAGVPNDGFLVVGEGQFTSAERIALRRGLRSIVEVETPDG